MTNTWGALREALLLIEAAEYRGVSGWTFENLISLFSNIIDPDHSMEKGERRRKALMQLKPAGGAIDCAYDFDRKGWGGWQSNPNSALAKAATDTARVSQYPGTPRGGTVMKRSYGGRVVYQPGRRDQSHEMRPSAMDTYDVLMRAEGDVMTRIAWAPSQGRFEERAARLEDLMAGRDPLALRHRPQPEKPEPQEPETPLPPAQPVPRVGQNVRRASEDEPERPTGAGGGRNTGFSAKLAKHDREYVPGVRKRRGEEGEEQPLFPPKRGK